MLLVYNTLVDFLSQEMKIPVLLLFFPNNYSKFLNLWDRELENWEVVGALYPSMYKTVGTYGYDRRQINLIDDLKSSSARRQRTM